MRYSTVRPIIILSSLTILCVLAPSTSASITIITTPPANDPIFFSYSEVTTTDDDIAHLSSTLPTAVATAELPPDYSSVTSLTYSSSGGITTFSSSFEESRGSELGSLVYGATIVNFKSDVDIPFTISGAFSNSAGKAHFLAYLRDTVTNNDLFANSYDVDGAAGLNLTGDLTGILLADREYSWNIVAYTQALDEADPAQASGKALLTIGPEGAVPEKSSLIVWSVLALLIVGGVWLRRTRVAVSDL
jgi:hypothetical protein